MLESLNLSLNGLDSLPDEFSKLQLLRKLDLSSNLFTEIPNSVFLLTNLEELSFSYNKISSIPEDLSNLKRLRKLILYDNPISEVEQVKIKSYVNDSCDVKFKY